MRFCGAVLFPIVLLGAEPVSFEKSVRPILAERCQPCHNTRSPNGGFSLDNTAALAKAAGSRGRSSLLEAIQGDKPRMPKAGPPLTPEQVAVIRRWVEEGAKASLGPPETWWSLKPLVSPAVPPDPTGWGRTPVDRFVAAGLRGTGLTPSKEADRRTLIRRLYFDLHGLPPPPKAVDAFLADPSADAYDRLVDRLLASERYGERWARHWLDVAHFGESHGYDKDKPRRNAWPYRDWVIRALNSDKPYPRFIEEQIAGDVLFPDDPQALAATGFLAAGPWDFVGHQELREGTTDKDLTRVLDRDDMVATVVSTFTSMTAHCARCHDHKFDPIPQKEYYGLQAVFAGVDRVDRPFDDDPATHRRRQELLRRKHAVQLRLQPLLDRVEFASNPEIVSLDSSIQDASLLIVHMGAPKTPAEAEEKKRLEARRTADRKRRQELVDAIVGPETYAAIERIRAEFAPIDAELNRLPKPRWVYAVSDYFPRAGTFRPALSPRPVHVLTRGSVSAPGESAVPGALSCVPELSAQFPAEGEGERRAALARWLSDGRNVLTWRSIVNRVWQYHFGSGIVETAGDFGRMGGRPSHPELLDWLAVWFRDEAKGSLKALHRLLVTSAVYRQDSAYREDGSRADADNRLLWRMNRTRLDAEALRDSMLAVAGKLDLTAGGPSVEMFRFKDDHSPVYDYASFDPDSPGAHRRSIYRFIVRSVPDPFMERLDCPDPSILTPKRSTTITAIQALATWNNRLVLRTAEHFAERLAQSSTDPKEQVRNAIRWALGRAATSREESEFRAYAARHGLANLARVLFNTNEFLFVD